MPIVNCELWIALNEILWYQNLPWHSAQKMIFSSSLKRNSLLVLKIIQIGSIGDPGCYWKSQRYLTFIINHLYSDSDPMFLEICSLGIHIHIRRLLWPYQKMACLCKWDKLFIPTHWFDLPLKLIIKCIYPFLNIQIYVLTIK